MWPQLSFKPHFSLTSCCVNTRSVRLAGVGVDILKEVVIYGSKVLDAEIAPNRVQPKFLDALAGVLAFGDRKLGGVRDAELVRSNVAHTAPWCALLTPRW